MNNLMNVFPQYGTKRLNDFNSKVIIIDDLDI